MKYHLLGNTGIKVSKICLGTMTWGEQNTEAEAHEQLDFALAQGVNFIDTAEMYPVPPNKDTYSTTEQYIGSWIKQRGKREDFVLASKIAGPTSNNRLESYIRGGNNFSRAQIFEACESSLKRLNTDYLDIYQLHWPERQTNFFGKLGVSELSNDEQFTPFAEIVEAMSDLVKQGKIRHYGLSNETPWGVMQYLGEQQKTGIRPASVQNPYSLLNRTYEVGMAEMSLRENLPLLAYSPLAFGMLTGKYRNGAQPQGARLTLFERFQRYSKPKAVEAIERYAAIAEQAGISLTTLSLAFVNSRHFLGANIIGATSIEQLRENIASIDTVLSADTLAAIEEVHSEISNPCP